MFKVIILAIVCFAIVNGNIKDDVLDQGEKLKDKVVDAAKSAADTVNENVETLKEKASDTLKAGQHAAGDAAKSVKKTAEKVADQASKQGEKVKRQASDAGEKVKSAAKTVVKEAEEEGDSLLNKVYSVLNDVKDSLWETAEVVGKHAADLTEQAKDKIDELVGSTQKAADKVKKNDL